MLSQPERFVAGLLKNGAVGVMPTDTIYGIVGSALRRDTVERIYHLRKRDPEKPMIILIASPGDLKSFGISPSPRTKKILGNVWPGKVSVVLPCPSKKFHYLHRGTKTLAFRMPAPPHLRRLLRATGPLVAPSANFEGEEPARTITEAKRYFGENVEFYGSAGRRTASKPSTLISLDAQGNVTILRKGAAKV